MSKHHHEGWQLQDRADGGQYCAACGDVMTAIPAEAFEAALASIQHLPTVENRSRKRTVQTILEAAAPYLLAKGWDEGYDEAEHEPIYHHEPRNPYRSET